MFTLKKFVIPLNLTNLLVAGDSTVQTVSCTKETCMHVMEREFKTTLNLFFWNNIYQLPKQMFLY